LVLPSLEVYPSDGESVAYSHTYTLLFIICALIYPLIYLVQKQDHKELEVNIPQESPSSG
jgi:hypothetical protein